MTTTTTTTTTTTMMMMMMMMNFISRYVGPLCQMTRPCFTDYVFVCVCVCVCVCHCNSMLGTPGWRADKAHPVMGINVHTRCRCILVYNYIGAHCVVHTL